MTVNLTFPKVVPSTWQATVSRLGVAAIATSYFALVGVSVWLNDASLFQNAGAIGVATVLSAFALLRRENERQFAFENFSIAVATADMMVLRASANNAESKQDFESAGEVVKKALANYDRTQRKSDIWLFWEILLSVIFTVQWGFGQNFLEWFHVAS